MKSGRPSIQGQMLCFRNKTILRIPDTSNLFRRDELRHRFNCIGQRRNTHFMSDCDAMLIAIKPVSRSISIYRTVLITIIDFIYNKPLKDIRGNIARGFTPTLLSSPLGPQSWITLRPGKYCRQSF